MVVYQVVKFRMASQISGDKWAVRDDEEMVFAGVLQGRVREFASYT
jgi:hypothetical protein